MRLDVSRFLKSVIDRSWQTLGAVPMPFALLARIERVLALLLTNSSLGGESVIPLLFLAVASNVSVAYS